jgi:hypothetical protein
MHRWSITRSRCREVREPIPIEGSDQYAVGYFRDVSSVAAPHDLHDLVERYVSDGSPRWELSDKVVLSADETLPAEAWETLQGSGVEGV